MKKQTLTVCIAAVASVLVLGGCSQGHSTAGVDKGGVQLAKKGNGGGKPYFAGKPTDNGGDTTCGTGAVLDDTNFGEALATWKAKQKKAMFFYGHIKDWNTSKVTKMDDAFLGWGTFNEPIGNWCTGNVTDMSRMFDGAYAFNQDISNWNTSKVEDMSEMFSSARAFNQPIGDWNTSNVRIMDDMFYDARSFDQDLSGWCVSEITQPYDFDDGAGFEGQTEKQPQWGSCP